MFGFWSRHRRGVSAAVLICWLWFSMAAAFTHVCGRTGAGHDAAIDRDGVVCVSCLWASVEKSADAAPAPIAPEQRLVDRVFPTAPEARPYIPTFVIPGRAPPA